MIKKRIYSSKHTSTRILSTSGRRMSSFQVHYSCCDHDMFNQYPIILVCLVQTVRLVKVESLRVEFLLKTDSGSPRDAEVTLFTVANPGSSLRFNAHWSAPPVSALARSGGFFTIDFSRLDSTFWAKVVFSRVLCFSSTNLTSAG